jgi:hypothetical protein
VRKIGEPRAGFDLRKRTIGDAFSEGLPIAAWPRRLLNVRHFRLDQKEELGMSLSPCPRAYRWETFESHHSLEHGKPVQPFVRSLRIFVSGSIRHVPFYSRRLLPTAALGGCTAACPLPLRLPKRNHAVVAIAVGYTRFGA